MTHKRLTAVGLALQRSGWHAEFNFDVPAGAWVSLVGPSGAGKTTLLELIAGFEQPTAGSLDFDGKSLLNMPVHKRSLAYVFQQNALFPYLTASENLFLALHDSGISKSERSDKVVYIAKRVGMEHRLSHRPGQMSGGELARMNLARALLRPARILLLDEPFASLDAPLRREMNGLVRELHAENNLTTLCVTHHPEDAFLFADHVMVFARGEIVAQGTPADLAKRPNSVETATLLDAGQIVEQDDGLFYVRNSQLTNKKSVFDSFLDVRVIEFVNWKLAQTGDGTVLVCLDSGRSFVLDAPTEFSGKLYFDASSAVRFPNSVTT